MSNSEPIRDMRLASFHFQRAFFRGLMHRVNVYNKKEYRLLRAFSTYPISKEFKFNLQTKAIIPELPVALRGMFSKGYYPNRPTSASAVTPLYTFRRQVNRYFDISFPKTVGRGKSKTFSGLRSNLVIGRRVSDVMTNSPKSLPKGIKGRSTATLLHSLLQSESRIRKAFMWSRPRNRKRRRV